MKQTTVDSATVFLFVYKLYNSFRVIKRSFKRSTLLCLGGAVLITFLVTFRLDICLFLLCENRCAAVLARSQL